MIGGGEGGNRRGCRFGFRMCNFSFFFFLFLFFFLFQFIYYEWWKGRGGICMDITKMDALVAIRDGRWMIDDT